MKLIVTGVAAIVAAAGLAIATGSAVNSHTSTLCATLASATNSTSGTTGTCQP